MNIFHVKVAHFARKHSKFFFESKKPLQIEF